MLYRFDVTFAFIDYFALLVSVLNFTSILAFCTLHCRCLLVAVANGITEINCTTLKNYYYVFSHTKKTRATSSFSQHVLANRATDFLLETADDSWKLSLRRSVPFPWCAPALNLSLYSRGSLGIVKLNSCAIKQILFQSMI
jgi:hypothetical protein